MSGLADTLVEDMRLQILVMLEEAAGYNLNHEILCAGLPSMGHRPSHDHLLAELAWLEEQRLVTTHRTGPLVVATATGRGVDAARGRARIPGIRRPRPA